MKPRERKSGAVKRSHHPAPRARATRKKSRALATTLQQDLDEAREQQVATSEVLKIIANSSGDIGPIFSAILSKAAHLCNAQFATLWLVEGDGFRPVAFHNTPAALAGYRAQAGLVAPEPDMPLGRIAATRRFVHITDIKKEPA